MRENIADSILERVNKRITSVAGKLAKQYQGVKPFNRQEAKPEDRLFWYEQLTPDDMNYFIQKYGRDAVNQFIYENETYKSRRVNNASK